jgi:hypothetical protein
MTNILPFASLVYLFDIWSATNHDNDDAHDDETTRPQLQVAQLGCFKKFQMYKPWGKPRNFFLGALTLSIVNSPNLCVIEETFFCYHWCCWSAHSPEHHTRLLFSKASLLHLQSPIWHIASLIHSIKNLLEPLSMTWLYCLRSGFLKKLWYVLMRISWLPYKRAMGGFWKKWHFWETCRFSTRTFW